jgi:antitoxin ParD1/3/4
VTGRLRFDLAADSRAFVERLVREGRYRSTSEVVCAGLRLLETREAKLRALRHALDEGLHSGPAEPFDFQAFVDTAKRRSPSGDGP